MEGEKTKIVVAPEWWGEGLRVINVCFCSRGVSGVSLKINSLWDKSFFYKSVCFGEMV